MTIAQPSVIESVSSSSPVLLRFVSRNFITDRWLMQNPDARVECWNCGKLIQIHDPRQKYCNAACKKRFWRAVRKIVYYRDCLWCGDEFEVGRRDKVYCSKRCVDSARREREGIPATGRTKVSCPECKTIFIKTARSQKYCSFECFMTRRMSAKRLYSRMKKGTKVVEAIIEISKDDISESIKSTRMPSKRTGGVFNAKEWAERARESQRRILEKYQRK